MLTPTDPTTGLYYYRARYYSPRLGRFLQSDPVGTSDDPNLYAYVSNDPANKLDPSGESWEDFQAGLLEEAGALEGVDIDVASETGANRDHWHYSAGRMVAASMGSQRGRGATRARSNHNRLGMARTPKPSGKPDAADKKDPGRRDPIPNPSKPQRAEKELEAAKKEAVSKRPMTKGPGAEPEWEGMKRPEQNTIRSDQKTRDRADHERNRIRDGEDLDDDDKWD